MLRWVVIAALAVVLVAGRSSGAGTAGPTPAAILVEAASGAVLDEVDADSPRPAGSFGQLLILLLGLERSSLDRMPLDAPVAVSKEAGRDLFARGGGRQVPLQAGRTYLLSDLMKAMLLSAADTAALAVAESIAGSAPLATELMTGRARLLGMTGTVIDDATGSSSVARFRDTSARDLARLARALVVFPKVLEWSSYKGIPFDRGTVLLSNPNPMLSPAVRGVDGLRIAPEGEPYSMIATARRDGMRLIAVVLDAADGNTCVRKATQMLEEGFARYRRVDVVRSGDRLSVSVDVPSGSPPSFAPIASETFSVLLREGQRQQVRLRYQVPQALPAPVPSGATVGELVIEGADGSLLGVVPVESPEEIVSRAVF